MEIFLIFIVIILMVFFETSRSAKITALERKITSLEAYLKKVLYTQNQKESAQKEAVSKVAEINPAPEKITPIQKPPAALPKAEPAPLPDRVNMAVPAKNEAELPKVENVPDENKVLEKPIRAERIAPRPAPAPLPPKEDWYTSFRKNNPDLEKFIGENILSKVAITILVIGIAFFVKFAIDKDWINEIARVGIGILCGGIVLGFAHYLHKKFKAFSSVLVAGGIAIFYFTIGIGFHQYHIFNQTTAFVIMFLITSFSVFISISYDRMELAALSLIGGFATPFMLSTGEGNYQVLFIYILILDVGMLVLAYLRKWNLINILAYCLTMLLYIVWLESKVIGNPRGPYQGALLFGAIFYVIFVLMNIINNLKEKRKFDAFELSILISNTFLFYGEGMHILHYYNENLQGLFSVCMAVFNLICAWLLFKKFKADEILVYLMIGLTLTFITIAAPVQLHGNYITMFWALESVLLMWLAQRSKIVLYRFSSVAVSVLMLFSLFMDWTQVYKTFDGSMLTVLLNKGFITGLVSAFSAGAIVLLLKKDIAQNGPDYQLRYAGIDFHAKNYSSFLRVVFIALLYFTGMFELVYQLKERMDGETATLIVIAAYHLLYVVALNYALLRYKNEYLNKSLYGLNLMSLIVFVLGFAFLPIYDLKENITKTEMNYIGFLFHYVCLTCLVLVAIKIQSMLRNKELNLTRNPVLTTVCIAVVVTYIASIELILHMAFFKFATGSNGSDLMERTSEFNTLNLHVVKIGFPILWGILAFVFLSIGMKKQNKTFRISGLILIALILLKLFTYDIKDASEAGKIIAFIILGVVLLIISFMYQKIKALLMDDSKKIDPEKNTASDPNSINKHPE